MKSILITGGTGTLGYGITEKLLQGDDYRRICILSRSEKEQASMARKFKDSRLRFFIGDVRDSARLYWAMEGCDDVIHAAALKRIEVGVYNPEEMVKTNVIGSINVVAAARGAEVKRVVLVSTDKAYEPISPYGCSKALAESLFTAADSGSTGARYSIVRYGNVWESAGSVVPLWRSILASGGRPAITDPECTRFFMLLSEAVNFVLGALEKMKGGEIFIPDLPAYDLRTLARAIVPSIESDCYFKLQHYFDIIGLPPHEKLHESMEKGKCSKDAWRMGATELRSHLK